MDMISPTYIPQYTGKLEQLEKDIADLEYAANGIRQRGFEVHERFQLLSSSYEAPEDDLLFASTAPVRDKAGDFAGKLEKVAGALQTYAGEVRPLAARLEQLQQDARDFVTSVEDDDDWTEDQKKVDRHNTLVSDVNAAVAAFHAAERKAAGTILGLAGKPGLVPDDGSHQPNMYGYEEEALDQSKDLPWGSPAKRTYDKWDIGHHVKSFVYDGIIRDNVVGVVQGLTLLATGDGDAWANLRDSAGGLGLYLLTPYDAAMDWAIGEDEETPAEKHLKETFVHTAKGMVAWDMWKENPARAAPTAIITILSLGAASTAGRSGKLGKAGKVGAYADPLGATVTLTSKALARAPKIVDVTARFRANLAASHGLDSPHSVLVLGDGSRLTVHNGHFTARDADGQLITAPARPEPSAADRTPSGHHTPPDTTPGHREPAHAPAREPVSAGARTGGPSTHHDTGPGGGTPPHHGSGDVPPAVGGRGGGEGPPAQGAPDGVRGHGADPDDIRARLANETDGREIVRLQVARANVDPDYFKEFYRRDGHRRIARRLDEFGHRTPQITRNPDNPSTWIAKSDLPPPVLERYLHDSPIHGDLERLRPTARHELEQSAAAKERAVIADNAAEDKLKKAEEAHAARATQETEAAVQQAEQAHSPLHGKMLKSSENFGEDVARLHAIPEHYPNAKRVDDGKFGNNRFDQIYEDANGRFIVVEAKGSTTTRLGYRKSYRGRLVNQGTREYFQTIVYEMRKRAETGRNPHETRLAEELEIALYDGRVDYLLIKAKSTKGQYSGYEMQQFDVG
ncbi:hypothetical protein ACMA1D_15765 [Streptomyces sp. 796.1]|uniref:hypothetical protein n=1 Tax=Streptomyces sp. 796.1 TaxID=3163029 RepID=UPI0039C99D3B